MLRQQNINFITLRIALSAQRIQSNMNVLYTYYSFIVLRSIT